MHLEQYSTSSHLAASVILMALRNGDVGPGRTVLDLGCGTGMLTVGAALVESDLVFGVDMDDEALAVAESNVEDLELQHIVQLIQAQVPFQVNAHVQNSLAALGTSKTSSGKRQNYRESGGRGRNGGRRPQTQRGGGRRRGRDRERWDGENRNDGDDNNNEDDNNDDRPPDCISTFENRDLNGDDTSNHNHLPLRDKCVDTVLTNPPFGTKQNAGIDVQFLKEATRLARCTVYSFHKTSTRPFLLRTIEQWGFQPHVVAEMKFDLPNVYKFHRQGEVNIEVDLLRITVGKPEGTIESDHATEQVENDLQRSIDEDSYGDGDD